MTIIIPKYNGSMVLLFVDDIEYIETNKGISTIYYRDNIEITTALPLYEIQKKIEAASIKIFKFN